MEFKKVMGNKNVESAVLAMQCCKNNADLIRAYYNVKEFPIYDDIALRFGVCRGTIKYRLRKLREQGIIDYSRVNPVYSTMEFINSFQQENKKESVPESSPTLSEELNDFVIDAEARDLFAKSKEALLQQLLSERSRTKLIADQCQASILKLKIRPMKVVVKHDFSNNNSMHLLISDVQVGQFTDPVLTAGLTKYSYEDFKKRLAVLLEKVAVFKDLYGKQPVTKLVVNLLGDIVEGETIYPGQAFYIDQCAVDQIFSALGEFTSFFKTLSEMFGLIEIFSVWGNHGRVGLKGMNHTRTNWDYIFYRSLQTALSSQPNIKMYVSESPLMFIKHGDFNFFLYHGDGIRRYYGIPYYGLDRMAKQLPSLANMLIHYVLVGHHHRDASISLPNGRMIVNGCFPGGSLFSAVQLFETSVPRQIMFMFHNKRGIHSVNDLVLDDAPRLVVGEGGIYESEIKIGA